MEKFVKLFIKKICVNLRKLASVIRMPIYNLSEVKWLLIRLNQILLSLMKENLIIYISDDIINNYSKLQYALHPDLKIRTKLKGLNPYSPINLEEISIDEYSIPNNYKKMEKIINSQLRMFCSSAKFQIKKFDKFSTKSFSKSSLNN